MFLVVRRVVLGENGKPATTLRARGPKSYKKFRKRRKNKGPRPLFGALWAPIDRLGGGSAPPWGRFGHHPGVCKLNFCLHSF